MAAGYVLTQATLESEIAARVRMMNRLKFEVAAMKAQTDALGAAGVLALPVGGRVTGSTMVQADADNLLSALADLNTSLQNWPVVFAARVWGTGF